MRIISNTAAMQKCACNGSAAGVRIGFVPTMGYLHAGHLSLVKRARQAVGKNGKVVVSIYVNPTQFAPTEDLSKYPRDLKRDLELLRELKVDVVFTPSDAEMYPSRNAVHDRGAPLSRTKIQHLRRRRKIVANDGRRVAANAFSRCDDNRGKIVQHRAAGRGGVRAERFSAAAIIKRMVGDLNFPVKIIVAPTLRERDGLAMSSRNKYLVGDLRRQATILWRAIQTAQAAVKKSKTISAAKLKADLKKLIEAEPDAKLDYVEFFEPETLSPVSKVTHGTQMALAVFIGKTRLIDNAKL